MARGLFKAGLALFLISIISKLMGFFREILIANYFGTSYSADAYYIALTPSTLAITFSITISSVFLPLFVKYSSDRRQSFLFANNVLLLFLIGVTALYFIILFFTEFFINILAPGLPLEGEILSITLIKYLFPLVFIVIAIQIYTLMLNTFEDYIASAACVIPNNLIIILYLWIFGVKYGIVGVALITLIANIIQLFILYVLIRKTQKYRILNNVTIWNANSKVFIILLLPIMVSSGFSQINAVVDRLLASNISEGAIASLSYAFRLRGIATGIFITQIITLTFPKLAKHSLNNDYSRVNNLTQKSLYALFLMLIPLSLIFLFFSRDIIQVLFERGNFTKEATSMTSEIFWAYSIGIIAIGFREVTLRAFYSYGDTKTPTYIMIFGSLTNVCLSYLLINPLGLMGLGIATSISFFITGFITMYLLRKKYRFTWSPNFATQMYKLVFATLIVSFSLYYLKNVFIIEQLNSNLLMLVKLSFYGVLSYIIFLLSLFLFKEREIINLINKVRVKLNKRKNK